MCPLRWEEANRRLEQEIHERQKLIEELNAFAHTVAHDLQNPLSIITAYVELLQARWPPRPSGGAPPRTEAGATVQADGMVRFWVKDNGDGLKPEEQARVFAPFTRFDQVCAEGTGVGLSIVQRIVEKLGGR